MSARSDEARGPMKRVVRFWKYMPNKYLPPITAAHICRARSLRCVATQRRRGLFFRTRAAAPRCERVRARM